MATVGYLLGAGASAECIPVVNAMADDLTEMASNISGIYTRFEDKIGFHVKEDEEKSSKIGKMLGELADICNKHYSVDTDFQIENPDWNLIVPTLNSSRS